MVLLVLLQAAELILPEMRYNRRIILLPYMSGRSMHALCVLRIVLLPLKHMVYRDCCVWRMLHKSACSSQLER
jgi:hypothetical protein